MQDDLRKKRGQRVCSLRKEHGLTLEGLAQKVGVKYQSISGWEKGVTSPSADNIERLSLLFNVHPTWLWNGLGEKYISKCDPVEPALNDALAEYGSRFMSAEVERYCIKLSAVLNLGDKQTKNAMKATIDIFHNHVVS